MSSLKRNPDFANDSDATSSDHGKNAKRLETVGHTHQNTSAARQPIVSAGQQQSTHTVQNDSVSFSNVNFGQVESIRDLGRQMDGLRHERSHYAEQMRNLETQISESEAACGRMLQKYLELGRAIALREKHIRDDKENLQRIQKLKESKGRELDAVLTKISKMVSEADDMS